MTKNTAFDSLSSPGGSGGPQPPTPEAPRPPASAAPPAAPLQRIPLPSVKPVFTYVFLVANLLVYAATLAFGNLPDGTPLLFDLGWKDSAAIAAGEYWRLVTPIFLHAGPVHLFFNSYALYVLGPQVERVFGYVRFVAIYLLAGIAGVIASMAFRPATYSVGASGAIFGLIGALIVYLYRHRELFGGMGRRRLTSAIQVAGINLLIGLGPGIDNWGHIGGMVGGAAVTWLLGPVLTVERDFDGSSRVEDRSPMEERWWAVFLSGAVLMALTALIIFARP